MLQLLRCCHAAVVLHHRAASRNLLVPLLLLRLRQKVFALVAVLQSLRLVRRFTAAMGLVLRGLLVLELITGSAVKRVWFTAIVHVLMLLDVVVLLRAVRLLLLLVRLEGRQQLLVQVLLVWGAPSLTGGGL